MVPASRCVAGAACVTPLPGAITLVQGPIPNTHPAFAAETRLD